MSKIMSMRMIGGLKNRSKFLPNIPYLFLRFNESSGATVHDSSGNSRDQTLTGSSANFWINGRNGRNCGYFDASIPNYISLPIAYFDGTNGSFFYWTNADWTNMVSSTSRSISTYHSGGANYINGTYLTGLKAYNFYVSNGFTFATPSLGVMTSYDNTWIHVGWTWCYPGSGDTTIIPYLNGEKVVSGIATIAGQLSNPDTSFNICKYTTQYFTGYIQDFFFSQECLSDYEVELLYKY